MCSCFQREHMYPKKRAEKPHSHMTLDHFYEEFAQKSNSPQCLHFLSSLSVEFEVQFPSIRLKWPELCDFLHWDDRWKWSEVSPQWWRQNPGLCLLISNSNLFTTKRIRGHCFGSLKSGHGRQTCSIPSLNQWGFRWRLYRRLFFEKSMLWTRVQWPVVALTE